MSPAPDLRGRPAAGPRLRLVVCALAVSLLAGCSSQRTMMPTPVVYAAGLEAPFSDALPGRLRGAEVNITFATDRVEEPRADGRLDYGLGRSPSFAVGVASVRIGDGAGWPELVADASSGERSAPLYLNVDTVGEVARTPDFPLPYDIIDGRPQVDADVQELLEGVGKVLEGHLKERLAYSPRKEILLYVHGVANTFEDALFTTAELWHYMGREFVPIAYSWPAGKSGLLRGYTYDRESSEFTVFHFKRLLSWLARLEDVEGIHIVAHSRGTDVVSTGVRELLIETFARGEDPLARLKLRNVVLAAPDINLEIAMMRTATEYFPAGMKRLTLYTSPHDEAIGVAEFLFAGGLRLGQLVLGRVPRQFRRSALVRSTHEPVGDQAVVEYDGERGGAHGHDYFRMNPAVSSDLVLTVRYDRSPGPQNGRPLRNQQGGFWQIGDDYLLGTAGE